MKNSIAVFSILFLFFLIFPNNVKGATYYVSTTGIDSNNGSITTPWRDVNASINKISLGDTLVVRGGVYTGQILINKSINLVAYSNENPILEGKNSSSLRDGHLTVDVGVNNVTVNGFTIQNTSGYGISNLGSNNTFSNNKIKNTSGPGIWTRNGSGNVFRSNEVFHAVTQNSTSVSDTKIICKVTTTGWPSAVNTYGTSSNNLFEGNYIHDNCGEGIVVSNGDRVIGNVFKDNWSINIYVDGKNNVLIDKNFIYETETSYIPRGSDGYYRNLASGLNVADEIGCGTKNNTFTNNVVANARYGFGFYNYSSCSGVINTKIVNNIFVNSWDYGIRIQGTNSANSGSTIANNIIYSKQGKAMLLENPSDFNVQNNQWYFSGGNSAGQFQWGSSLYDFTQWSTLSNRITGNIWSAPQFVGALPSDPNQYTPEMFNLKNTPFPTSASYQTPSPSPSTNRKNGDANGDNIVDGIDYVIWIKYYGQNVVGSQNGNFDLIGGVDGNDFNVWLSNYLL